jgi:hypothetical protein
MCVLDLTLPISNVLQHEWITQPRDEQLLAVIVQRAKSAEVRTDHSENLSKVLEAAKNIVADPGFVAAFHLDRLDLCPGSKRTQP